MFKRKKTEEVALRKIPTNLGIIMDGNGRWAKQRNLPRYKGHIEGAKTFRRIGEFAADVGVKCLTFYAFSTENWKRPKDEVDSIMALFEKNLDEVKDFIDEEIRVRFIGDRTALSETLREKMRNTEESSKHFTDTTMILAINYGGQDEICNAVKRISEKVKNGEVDTSEITTEMITPSIPSREMWIELPRL